MLQHTQPQYQILYRIGDDKPWRGDDARALIGRLFKDDPPETIAPLFHHRASGELIPAMSALRFRGGNGFFGVLAVGSQAIDTLQSVEHIVRRRLSEHLNRPIRTESSDTDFSVSLDERMTRYRAHMVVFARKHQAMSTVFDMPDERLPEYLRKMALRDIRIQADALNLDLPAESFPFQITGVGRRARIPLNKEGHRLYVGAVTYVDFLTTLNFKGHWTLGGLLNRGYGSLRRCRPTTTESRTMPIVSGELYAQL